MLAQMAELIGLMDGLSTLVREHANIIRQYYLGYLKGCIRRH